MLIDLPYSLNKRLANLLRGFDDDLCDPHTVTTDHYPSLLIGLSVQKTSPLKLKATFRLPNSTKQFSFEGMVFSNGFSAAAGIAACRSLGCSKSTGFVAVAWTQQTACEFTCPDGTSAMQNCRYMISNLQCSADAMNLLECLTNEPFWQYGSTPPSYNAQGIDLKCIECVD
ncbi:unnamed protein product [Adineta ricciae]|uniref:SRCR domain-containing protein n=1 Tax=Adineta ricciae TaxID=249248 RepID=A0A815M8I0_ADIRI|nr:unnamed protein product [Adineta ricciae]